MAQIRNNFFLCEDKFCSYEKVIYCAIYNRIQSANSLIFNGDFDKQSN